MFAEERYQRILKVVNSVGKATVAELSDILQVSSVTVRRDLEKLEERELLVRTHGGAIALPDKQPEAAFERSFSEKEEALSAEKERIAEAASALVGEHESVLLTPGTTCMMLAKKLCTRKNLTLVTNAANFSSVVGNGCESEIILLGGKMRETSYATVGSITELALDQIRVDKVFLGVDGFHIRDGLTTPNLAEASVNRRMIAIAKEVIVVADHTKFGRVAFSHIASLSQVHRVISDKGLPAAYVEQIEEAGIRLLLV